MAMKEDIAVLKNDMKWMKANLQNISGSMAKSANSIVKIGEAVENNKMKIAKIQGIGIGLGAVTVVIALASFFMAIH
jgi:hypothetical protein